MKASSYFMKITSTEKEPLRPQNSERGKRPSHLIEEGMVRNAGCYVCIALQLVSAYAGCGTGDVVLCQCGDGTKSHEKYARKE